MINKNRNFLVDFLKWIEDFNVISFKKSKSESKLEKQKIDDIKEELRESETTINDVANQRKSHVRHLFRKVLLLGFIIVLITGAFILGLQDNDQKPRREIVPEEVFKDKSSFGSINQNDYFMKQNILNDKIDVAKKDAQKENKELKKLIIEQTNIVKENTNEVVTKFKEEQARDFTQKLKDSKENILKVVSQKLKNINSKQINLENKIKKVKTTKNLQKISLNEGKIIFPNLNKNAKKSNNKIEEQEYVEVEEEEFVEEEIAMNSNNIIQTQYSTNTLNKKIEKIFKPFKIDLTLSMAKVTLLEGVKAASSFNGLANPSPALMIIEDILYTANEEVADLKGCFLSGVALGNINTSRVEIFGTHLSCIIVADDGKKYKIEKVFKKNRVWIKGEDGGTGIQGQIVDSSGKILAKGAAIGFMQGLSNFFLAKAVTTSPIQTDGTTSLATTLDANLRNGATTGVNNSFELIIKRYEKILDGYYPFIDTKGGRTNLTAVFGGKMQLEVTKYIEPSLDELRRTNLSRGYQE